MSIAMGHGPRFCNSSTKHADSAGQSLFVLGLAVNVRTRSGLPRRIGDPVHRSTAQTTTRPTTAVLFTVSRPSHHNTSVSSFHYRCIQSAGRTVEKKHGRVHALTGRLHRKPQERESADESTRSESVPPGGLTIGRRPQTQPVE